MNALKILYSVAGDFYIKDKHFSNLLDQFCLNYEFLTRAILAKEKKEKSREYASAEESAHLEARSLISEFSDILKLECSVESNKIAVSLNLNGLQLYYIGPKKIIDDYQWILAMVALSAGDATVLENIEEPLKLEDSERKESWMW